LQSLKREAAAYTRNLERINARIAELEAASQSASDALETT
jgi:prefoldin subunit 5